MKKVVSLLLVVCLVTSLFSTMLVNSSAVSKKTAKISLKKKSASLVISKKNGKKVFGSTKIRLKKSKGVKILKTTYKSSKKSVAKVNKNGKVTAVKNGSATISVKVKYTFKKETRKETLTFKVKVLSDYKSFLKRLSKFSGKLYNMSSKYVKKNYSMSPVSIYMALSMLYSISDSEVKSEIRTLTGMKASDFNYTAKLIKNLNYEQKEDGKVACKLQLANSIWYDSREKLNQNALEKIGKELSCESSNVPFYENNKEANKKIREYIKEMTNGLIDRDFNIDSSTLLALINTLYFKDNWDYSDLSTKKMEFESSTGKKKREFLIGDYECGRAQQTKCSTYFYAATMHGYKMKFILPKKGYTLKQAMSAENLNKINSRKDFKFMDKDKTEHYTRCIFPSFKIESDTPLKTIFQKNGYLKNAFSEFSSPLTDKKLFVSDIAHSTVLDVNKKGIEGAAVTIVMACASSIHVNKKVYHDFTLDKNFGYILTDSNDVVLFEGQVTE